MKHILIVLIVATVALASSVGWHHYSATRITEAQQQLKVRAWLSVLPEGSYDNRPLEHPLPLPEPALSHSTIVAAYLATLRGQPSAVVLHNRFQGYEGPIDLLVAIDPQGRLVATKVLEQQETPGLGARIAETGSPWLQGFSGRSHGNTPETAWALKRDNGQFDQIAGATVTSRAVIHGVQDALRYFDQQARLWLPERSIHE